MGTVGGEVPVGRVCGIGQMEWVGQELCERGQSVVRRKNVFGNTWVDRGTVGEQLILNELK